MNYILLFFSIVMETGKNIFSNHFSKTKLNTFADTMFFNMICSLGSVLFCLFMPLGTLSGYSVAMAVLFSLATAGMLLFSLLALKTGPMSYSMLFLYLGMIISTAFGIIYHSQPASFLQCIGFVLMVVTFWFGTDKSANRAFSLRWLFYAMMSFLSCGLLGVVQLLHQSSPHADEINSFMVCSFGVSVLLSVMVLLFCKRDQVKASFTLIKTKVLPVGLVSGVLYGAVNIINLYLSGRLPAIIFFPIVNGGVLILSSIAAIVLFREKPSVRQTIGIVTGILSVCFLGL